MKAMEDKKLTPREACVFALMSMGEGATVGDIMKVVDQYVISLGVQSPETPFDYSQMAAEILNTKPIENIRVMMGYDLGNKIMQLLGAIQAGKSFQDSQDAKVHSIMDGKFYGDDWTNEEKIYFILSQRTLSRTEATRAILHLFQSPAPDEKPFDMLEFGIEIVAAMKASAYGVSIEDGRAMAKENTVIDIADGMTPEQCERHHRAVMFERELLHKQANYVAEIALAWLNTRAHVPIQKPNADLAKEILANLETYRKFPEFSLFQIIKLQVESILFAPSAGKDRTNEAIKVCADFAEAVVSGLKEKHRSLKEKHEREVSKLIEALERAKYACEFGNQSLGCIKLPNGAGYTAVPESAYDVICIALAAYKGKEAKEGGEG